VPKTPDRHPGPLIETEEIILGGDEVTDPTVAGALRYVGGAFRLKDIAGVFDPRGTTPPTPGAVGQVLYSVDGVAFTTQQPLTADSGGWISNSLGLLLVTG
jgi:hypothetical protein